MSISHKQSGVALVIVLWMLALLTIMAASYSATMRTETLLTAHYVQSAKAHALAEAGIWFGVNELLKPQIEQSWRLDGNPNSINFGDGTIQIKLYDEAGKIDLNTARVELLDNLLKAAGMDETESITVLQAILDWRDRDKLKRNFGAEDDDYATAGLDYGAKDGPFNSIGELRLVLGMTDKFFQRMAPALTVHSHQAVINPHVAPREVLLAIPGLDETNVDEFLLARSNDDNTTTRPGGADSRFFSSVRSNLYTISSEANSKGRKAKLDAVVLLKPNASPPVSVLSWREAHYQTNTEIENLEDQG